MCNKATYQVKFVAHSCLTPGCTRAHGSNVTFQGLGDLELISSGHLDVTVHCCSSLSARAEPLLDKHFLSEGPIWSFVCFCTELRQLQPWRESVTMKVSNHYSPAVYYMLQWGVPDKMTKCLKSIHFTMLFTTVCASLKINKAAFTAQSTHNPSANGIFLKPTAC